MSISEDKAIASFVRSKLWATTCAGRFNHEVPMVAGETYYAVEDVSQVWQIFDAIKESIGD